MKRSPTFFVGTQTQRSILEQFQRREQQLDEQYLKIKPLCLSARSYQQTHPAKLRMGYKDADAVLTSPMLLGVCDGVSQLEDFGLDPSLLPQELLQACEELAVAQLVPETLVTSRDRYKGPITLLKEAYLETESHGSTTVLLAALDNSSRIHGKPHPMIAVLSIGDCELLMLRRSEDPATKGALEAVFHTEMQRINQHTQMPLQLARVDGRIDETFEQSIALEVIEEGSAVHCVSVHEGDVLVLGSDGVFDNLFLDEVVDICNQLIAPGGSSPSNPATLGKVAERIVKDAHSKVDQMKDAPIGRGGKVDDTSVIVAEVVQWTDMHRDLCTQVQERRQRKNLRRKKKKNVSCAGCEVDETDSSGNEEGAAQCAVA